MNEKSYEELLNLYNEYISQLTEINEKKADILQKKGAQKAAQDLRKLNVEKTKIVKKLQSTNKELIQKRNKRNDDFYFFFIRNSKGFLDQKTFQKILRRTNRICPCPGDLKDRLRVNNSLFCYEVSEVAKELNVNEEVLRNFLELKGYLKENTPTILGMEKEYFLSYETELMTEKCVEYLREAFELVGDK